MMFKTDAAQLVGCRHQEVVVVEMARAVELVGLLDQLAVDSQDVVRHFQ